jgi:hypothetical protein
MVSAVDPVETPGPIDQAISQCRMALKPPYLAFLGSPEFIEITYGPTGSFLLHNPARRQGFVDQILPPPGTPLRPYQDLIELLLVSGKRSSTVDDHGRIRIEKVHLTEAGLEANSQAYLMPRAGYGWIEVWNEPNYFASLRQRDDQWQQAMNEIIEHLQP